MTFRMNTCHECKKNGDNERCMGTNEDIENCYWTYETVE